MSAKKEGEAGGTTTKQTTVTRTSDRELVVARTVSGPAQTLFDAFTRPELLKRWWAPRSMGMSLRECEVDARVGGRCRFVIGSDAMAPMEFTSRYLEVAPASRLVWVSDEAGPENESVTTVTFEERNGKTRVVMGEVYPSKEALDEVASGMEAGMGETFEQLEELVVGLG